MAKENENPSQIIGPKDIALPTLERRNLVGFDNRYDATRIRSKLVWTPRIQYKDAIPRIPLLWALSRRT